MLGSFKKSTFLLSTIFYLCFINLAFANDIFKEFTLENKQILYKCDFFKESKMVANLNVNPESNCTYDQYVAQKSKNIKNNPLREGQRATVNYETNKIESLNDSKDKIYFPGGFKWQRSMYAEDNLETFFSDENRALFEEKELRAV